MTRELKIGRIEGLGRGYQKFLVAIGKGSDNSLYYYACPLETGEKPSHSDIAEKYNLDDRNIIGGGRADNQMDESVIGICDRSGTYGAMSRRIMEAYKPVLLCGYQAVDPKVKDIGIWVQDCREDLDIEEFIKLKLSLRR